MTIFFRDRQESAQVSFPLQMWDSPQAAEMLERVLVRKVTNDELELIRSTGALSDIVSEYTLCSFGKKPAEPLGYAALIDFETQSIEDVFLPSEFDGGASYFDKNGHPVEAHEVSEYRGFEQFSESGNICYIHLLEVFDPGSGHGKKFVEQLIESNNRELIFLHARDERAEEFFVECGFRRSGIYSGEAREPVLVYVSPPDE